MCGIAGIISRKAAAELQQQIMAATRIQSHRGPEDEQYWLAANGFVALGHQRLCIIDPDKRSAQPFRYLNRYSIVHNGELYNYIELKEELKKKGCTFSTTSDTEVIVAAYHAYKESCLQQFDGMFAFAIWDDEEQTLFAARDRFGEKPFYFFYNGEELLFASEMKALWAAGISKEVNSNMLYNYLTIGYTGNPFDPQETFYQHIAKLPSASFLKYTANDAILTIEKYWIPGMEKEKAWSETEAIETFISLFTDSIRKRLRSDVGIGTSLSGGLDSSSIIAFCSALPAAQYTHKCFTAVFEDFAKSEDQYATLVADNFNLRHHLVSVNENDLLTGMDDLMWHQEEPVGSASVLAQYKVFEKAKQHGVTVLLDGQGADELLGGYHNYYKWYWQELYAAGQLKKSGEIEAARALGVQQQFGWKNKATAIFPHFALALLQRRNEKKASRQSALNKDFIEEQKRFFYYSAPAEPTLNGVLYFHSFVHGLEELLRYADRNSMAHAVEVRLPFLNHQLAAFLFSLPPNFKIHQGWTKWLLRKAVANKLPAGITWRKDKIGFEPPQKRWMQNKMVQEQIKVAKKRLVEKNILAPQVLKKEVQPSDAHAANNADWKYWSASYLFR